MPMMSAVEKGLRDQTWTNDICGSMYTITDQIDTHLFQDCNSISNYFSDPISNSEDFSNVCLTETSPDVSTKTSNALTYQNVSSPLSAASLTERRTITELSSGSSHSNIRYTTSPLPRSPSQEISRAIFPPVQDMPTLQSVAQEPLQDLDPCYSYQLESPIVLPNAVRNEISDMRTTPRQSMDYCNSELRPQEQASDTSLLTISDRRKSGRLRGQLSPADKRQHFSNPARPYLREKRPRKNRVSSLAENNNGPIYPIDQRPQLANHTQSFVESTPACRTSLEYSSPSPLLQTENTEKGQPYVRIIEQPQQKALRFRYICEGRSAGSIPGVNSTPENKTFPTIKVYNFKGAAQVVVSCVTVEEPHRPHPHNLVGKEGCSDGICRVRINSESMECSFSNLGIQCVKKKDVTDALRKREKRQIDPFATGFAHRNQPQNIDLNAVRLCFQIYLEGPEPGIFGYALSPIVSDPIYDKKATSDLTICRLSDCTSSAAGGREIILLCDKVNKDDIQVRFFEIREKTLYWEAYGDFQAADVHKQMAIAFRTPKYASLDIREPATVYVELVQPSDRSRSEPRPFQFLPLETDPQYVRSKVAKICNPSMREDLCSLLGDVSQYLSIPDEKSAMEEDPFTQCY